MSHELFGETPGHRVYRGKVFQHKRAQNILVSGDSNARGYRRPGAQLSDLRILAISHFTELTTEVMQRILDGCPALEVVKLCNGIVVDRIIGLLCKPRNVPLKRILFRKCRGFTSFAWNRMQVMCAQTTIDVIRGTND